MNESPLIQIGHSISSEDAKNLSTIITDVFKSGYECHMDQSTIQAALSSICDAISVKNVVIQNCTMGGSTTINKGEE